MTLTPFFRAWRKAAPVGLTHSERNWLVATDSLTQALEQHGKFRVQCLTQSLALPQVDEWQILGLPRRQRVWQRDVVLLLNERPVVFAHTVVPYHCSAQDWPAFSHLGNRSLGLILFADPKIQRQALQYAQISAQHGLYKKFQETVNPNLSTRSSLSANKYLARRSIFLRNQARMLVTEVFFPSLFNLR